MILSKAPSAAPIVAADRWSVYRQDEEAASGKRQILKNLTFQVMRGEKILLVGPSGCGKSTALHALAGLDRRDDGQWQEGALNVSGQHSTGLVQQDPDAAIILNRTDANIAFGPENLGVPQERLHGRIAGSLATVGLKVPLDHPTQELSGGQKQRMAIAGIVAMSPELMLLDEPTAHLDPCGVLEVRDAALRAVSATGATLIVVEHRIASWYDFVDRIIVLSRQGEIIADGTPDSVVAFHEEYLKEQGVWVPGFVPETPLLKVDESLRVASSVTLIAQGLQVNKAAGLPKRPLTSWGKARCRKKLLQISPTLQAVDFGASNRTAGKNIVCISGDNGVGKTTLALSCASLVAAAAGEVTLTVNEVESDVFSFRDTALPHGIGMVLQEPEHQFVTECVSDEIWHGISLPQQPVPAMPAFDEAQQWQLYQFLVSHLSLEHCQKQNPYTLSAGEKRRLALAAVLAARPRAVILDEPTSGQDSGTWQQILRLCRGLADAGVVLVVVSHDELLRAELLRSGAAEYYIKDSVTHYYLDRGCRGSGARDLGAFSQSNRSNDNREISSASVLNQQEMDLRGRGQEKRETAFFSSLNPLTKITMMMVFSVTAMASRDWLTAGMLIAVQLMLIPFSGMRLKNAALVGIPLMTTAAVTWLSTAILAKQEGKVIIHWGWYAITEDSAMDASVIAVRMIAVALSGCCLIFSTDSYDLSAALTRWLRLPQAFVFGALAAMRLLGNLTVVWKTLSMGRRSRGVKPRVFSQLVPFFVAAVRQGLRVADSMESLGMKTDHSAQSVQRTWLRPSVFLLRDKLMFVFAPVACVLVVLISVVLGSWRPLWG